MGKQLFLVIPGLLITDVPQILEINFLSAQSLYLDRKVKKFTIIPNPGNLSHPILQAVETSVR